MKAVGISKIISFAKLGPFIEATSLGKISFKLSGINLLPIPNPFAPLTITVLGDNDILDTKSITV